MIFLANIEWIGRDYGGRSSPPVVGLKPTIRFQRRVREWLSSAWDVEIVELGRDMSTGASTARMRLSKDASSELEYLKAGELIELLDAYRVIGVGKIVRVGTVSD